MGCSSGSVAVTEQTSVADAESSARDKGEAETTESFSVHYEDLFTVCRSVLGGPLHGMSECTMRTSSRYAGVH